MKLRYKLISAVILTMATTSSAFADEANAGIIHFTGELIEPSCVIEGDAGSTDSTVPLGTYPTSLFNEGGVGTESPLKSFTITLKNCPVATTGLPQVQLTFQGTHALTGSTSLLDVSEITTVADNPGGSNPVATGVGIAVSPAGADTTLLTMDAAEGQVYIDLPDTAGDAILAEFNARYKSFAALTTAGAADADMTVNIVYR
ncbi:type 1 fimbrial protein [Citrobacter sp. 506]|uniref:fimbrial protein n=1 Tax=Citrobacter sp. 506 TaxID=3156447 RepID=UPI003D240447